jgi:hypothetical protein
MSFQSNSCFLLAANKYKTMKQDKESNLPSIEQEQIIVPCAKINKLKVSSKANKGKTEAKETDGDTQRTKSKSKWKHRDK